ncbi:unnamed protein product [Amoebophrya sp. A25]|nr:unnamed protein product [Amoebophrya sp. A25]|eukprot:GSA25T00009649001.1
MMLDCRRLWDKFGSRESYLQQVLTCGGLHHPSIAWPRWCFLLASLRCRHRFDPGHQAQQQKDLMCVSTLRQLSVAQPTGLSLPAALQHPRS